MSLIIKKKTKYQVYSKFRIGILEVSCEMWMMFPATEQK